MVRAEDAGDAFQPFLRHLANNFSEHGGRQFFVSNCRSLFDLRGPGQQDMMFDLREWRFDLLVHGGPVVVEKERGSMVDGVELAMPNQ